MKKIKTVLDRLENLKLINLLTVFALLSVAVSLIFLLKKPVKEISAAWALPRRGNAPATGLESLLAWKEGLTNPGIYLFAGTFFVYLLKSGKDKKYYIGQTNDLSKRLRQHNAGKVTSTKFRRPFELVGYEIYETREKARWKEYKLKRHPREKRGFIAKLTSNKIK